MSQKTTRFLIAASGTGGHLFPALAVAQSLKGYDIQWLGVPDRLEQVLVPKEYPLHAIALEGFQTRFGLNTLGILARFAASILRVRKLLATHKIDAVFTTGGYIAAPAILAARWQGIPVVLHESNAFPGKVTRWFAPWCTAVAIGFKEATQHLDGKTEWVGTPVRPSFLTPQPLDLPIPPDAPLIVVAGGSQGAVAVNQLVRQCAPTWLNSGAYVVHLTGDRDPDALSFEHPHYFSLPFYDNMAGLFQRANFAVSRAGAGTLVELAATHTPALLIPYPYAADNHQAHNAEVFEKAGAALVCEQEQLTAEALEKAVLNVLRDRDRLSKMAHQAASLAVFDSSERLAALLSVLSKQ
ncbi:MAG: undecaprenyldiphospho-muramoylpentapeptide beta-N-acetylglucosaminyltransferase [Cyanobacteriota bacterium]|nr:undecaprenyldiphospho-muramoylpentapeptide beta-N-acetylglucosaminyltransferase [Cyanobacteriota bacterium]